MKFAELAGNMWDDAGALVLDMVKKRELEVKIEAEIPLAQAARAHELLKSRKTTGKLILVP